MNTVFGRKYNHMFIQQMVDTITSFLTEGSVRMKITVTKNLYLGCVWVEKYDGNKLLRRARYSKHNWGFRITNRFYNILMWESRFSIPSPDLVFAYNTLLDEYRPDQALRFLRS